MRLHEGGHDDGSLAALRVTGNQYAKVELRRQEEKMIKAVESAESEGRDAVDGLQRENAVLQTRKSAAVERRVAAEHFWHWHAA